jgi:hypothetical protein
VTATLTKERPILFSGQMVRAILDGRKTQTRRIVNDRKCGGALMMGLDRSDCEWEEHDGASQRQHGMCFRWGGGNGTYIHCPYGYPGDRLWVRETWADSQCDTSDGKKIAIYRADGERPVRVRWRPSIYMPRWASRITLEITGVRVERVHDIGKDGRKAKNVLAEGILPAAIDREREWFHADDAPAIAFSRLWNEVNGKDAWERNDWVWALTFKRIEAVNV